MLSQLVQPIKPVKVHSRKKINGSTEILEALLNNLMMLEFWLQFSFSIDLESMVSISNKH